MHRTKIVVLSLTGLALLAAAAGSVAASPAKTPWRIALTTNREGDSEIYCHERRRQRRAAADAHARIRRLPGRLSPDGGMLFYSQRRPAATSGS